MFLFVKIRIGFYCCNMATSIHLSLSFIRTHKTTKWESLLHTYSIVYPWKHLHIQSTYYDWERTTEYTFHLMVVLQNSDMIYCTKKKFNNKILSSFSTWCQNRKRIAGLWITFQLSIFYSHLHYSFACVQFTWVYEVA